jgi:uncharacterized protein with FMN-binding domain
MKKAIKLIIVIVVVILIVILVASVMFSKRAKGMDEYVNKFKISEVDLSEIENGLYTGAAEVGVVSVKVDVDVLDNEINNIKINKHFNGQGEPAEVIINDIIKNQSVKVDVISGATYSSIAILEAVGDALK